MHPLQPSHLPYKNASYQTFTPAVHYSKSFKHVVNNNMLQFFSSFLSFLPCFLSNHPTTNTALQQAFQIIFSFPHKLLQLIIHPTTSSSFYFLILSCIRSPLSCSTNPPKIPQNWAEVGGYLQEQ